MALAPTIRQTGSSGSRACNWSPTNSAAQFRPLQPPNPSGVKWPKRSSWLKPAPLSANVNLTLQIKRTLSDPSFRATGPLLEREHVGRIGALHGLDSRSPIGCFEYLDNAALD